MGWAENRRNNYPTNTSSDFDHSLKQIAPQLPIHSLEKPNLFSKILDGCEYVFNFDFGAGEIFPVKVRLDFPKDRILISHSIYKLGEEDRIMNHLIVAAIKDSWRKIDPQIKPKGYVPFLKSKELILIKKIRLNGKIDPEIISLSIRELLSVKREIKNLCV